MEAESVKIYAEALEASGSVEDASHALQSGALASIAISLKRIADEVCGVPYDRTPGADNSRNRMGLVDGIMHAIEQGLLAASQRG